MEIPKIPVTGRVVAMIRVSTNKQGVKSQRDVIQRWADSHKLSIARWYDEDERPRRRALYSTDFEFMIRDGEAGNYDWIVVDNKKRLGTRGANEFGFYATRLTRSGVRIWAIDKGELTKTDFATAIANVMDDVGSHEELVDKAKNVSRGKYANAKLAQYNGGPVPLGYDLVCRSPDDNEIHRVVQVARQCCVVVTGTVRRELRGKNNRPGKGKFDRYYFALSEIPERIATVQEIFRRFATESITSTAIARDLTRRRVDTVYGNAVWHQVIVDRILKNPIYCGKPAWGKTSQAAYQRIAPDGAGYLDPVWKGNREAYLSIPEEDWVHATTPCEELRIIDQETWNVVQGKLKGTTPGTRNPPRSDQLWLRPFIFCAGCGRGMRGWAPLKNPQMRSYMCSQYADYQGDNPTGCGKNRILAGVIEGKLEEFLQKVQADAKIATRGRGTRIDKLLLELGDRESVLYAVLREMRSYVEKHIPPEQLDKLGVEGGIAIDEAYRHYYEQETAVAREKIESERTELRTLTRSRKGLTEGGEADMILLDDIKACERRIAALKSQIIPLDERLDAIYADLERLDEAIVGAQVAIRNSSNREKAEALGKVLDRITVHCRHNPNAKGNTSRSILEKLVFVPVKGSSVEFVFDATPVAAD